MVDIYFDENYGKIYERSEKGKAEVYKYKSELGEITTQFIKREIPIKISGVNVIYYDIVTPYGYGGPYIACCNGDKQALLKDFYKEFKNYCIENNIVSEFIRFHPIVNNAEDFKEIYDTECIRKTLGTDLKKFEDTIKNEFSKSCRKRIRQAINKGISWKITPRPSDLEEFKRVYYATMDRNNASEYYYFDNQYFNDCIKYFKGNMVFVEAIYEDKTIAAGLYFIYNKCVHIHLSGTDTEYLHLSPAYILRYAITLWAIEEGYDMIHHGGGRTNANDDSLYLFKKQFAQNTEFDFYIGKKIWNKHIYDKLCQLVNANDDTVFFPKYREKHMEK